MSQAIDNENFWDLYVAECDRTKTRPTISDFVLWLEEKGYNDDMTDTVPDEVYHEAAVDDAERLLSDDTPF